MAHVADIECRHMHAASGVRGTLYTSIKYTHDGWPPVQVQQNGSWVLDFDFNAVDVGRNVARAPPRHRQLDTPSTRPKRRLQPHVEQRQHGHVDMDMDMDMDMVWC